MRSYCGDNPCIGCSTPGSLRPRDYTNSLCPKGEKALKAGNLMESEGIIVYLAANMDNEVFLFTEKPHFKGIGGEFVDLSQPSRKLPVKGLGFDLRPGDWGSFTIVRKKMFW